MNNLSLSEKKKLLSLAKRLDTAIKRQESFAKQANNLLKKISVRELAYPTTNASRNVVRRITRFEHMMNYTQQHLTNIAEKILNGYPPSIATMAHNNIIRNVTESIRRHGITPKKS